MSYREVVGGIIVRDSKVLLTQRRPGKSYQFLWESPGGKAEPGETHLQTLQRELREEIGYEQPITAEYGTPIVRLFFDPPEVTTAFVWTAYVVPVPPASWVPVLHEAIGLGWFSARELDGLTLTPANRQLKQDLQKMLRA